MKLNESPQLGDGQRMVIALYDFLRLVAKKVNGLSSGAMAARDNTGTAAPTAGTWAQGDQVINSTPTEAGTAGSKYVVVGWICTAGGTPGTWVPMRNLTGN